MKRAHLSLLATCAGLVVLVAMNLPAQMGKGKAPAFKTKEEKIKNAMSAAPGSIARNATILDWAKQGNEPAVLRQGSNGWTCLPDIPSTPTNDPVCADKIAWAWLQAWMNNTPPPKRGPIGVAYMLLGGSSASNDDPAASKPAAGKGWQIEPPHVMLFGTEIDHKVYSTEMKSGQPWIMFSGTPLEHLMVPVK